RRRILSTRRSTVRSVWRQRQWELPTLQDLRLGTGKIKKMWSGTGRSTGHSLRLSAKKRDCVRSKDGTRRLNMHLDGRKKTKMIGYSAAETITGGRRNV